MNRFVDADVEKFCTLKYHRIVPGNARNFTPYHYYMYACHEFNKHSFSEKMLMLLSFHQMLILSP